MTNRITLQPSGKQFDAEPGQSILDAAYHAGLNLQANCKNGSCGACIAELLDGQIEAVQNHDFICKPSAKGNQQFLLCCNTLKTDLVIRAAEVGSLYDLPFQTIETRVYKIDNLDDEVIILQLRTPRSKTLQFLAGQYVTLGIDRLKPRNKSIASCPCNGMYLHFHINKTDDDDFSDYIFRKLKTKQTVTVSGPNGFFTLDDSSRRPIIFIANGTGIAPIKSLIEHAIDLDMQQVMHLYWSMPEHHSHYLENYCHSWEDALDNFSYTPMHNNGNDAASQTATKISSHHPDLNEFDIYMNGPKNQAEDLIEQLVQEGLDEERLFVDSMKRY